MSFGGGFGSTAFGTKPAPAFGSSAAPNAFGTTNNAFGSKPSTSFGSPGTSNAFGAKPAANNAFGAAAPAAPAFGAQAAGGFGAPAAGGFGTPAAGAFGAPAAGGFGAFGAKPAAPAFGSPAAGAFGSPSAFGAKPATTGFGSPGAAPAFGAPSTAGGFGSFGAKPATSFGQPAGATTFGQPGAAGFGQPTTSMGFGQMGFGQQAAAGVAPGGFGNLAFGGAMNPSMAQQQPQQPQYPPEEQQIIEAIERLKRSYAPARNMHGQLVNVPEGSRNDECAFKYIALKRKDGTTQNNQALLYGNLLEQAEKDNADPDNYFAVEELGIESLKRRFDHQNTELEKAKGQVDKIREVIQEVNSSNQLLSSRVALLKNRQLDLNRRMLAAMKKIEIVRCHGTPLLDSERRYYRKLVEMAQRLERPLQVVQNMSINVALHEQPEEGAIESISEEDLASFIAALKKQSDGLEMLTDTLRKDLRDVDIIRQSVGGQM